jgi:hypothetical protein
MTGGKWIERSKPRPALGACDRILIVPRLLGGCSSATMLSIYYICQQGWPATPAAASTASPMESIEAWPGLGRSEGSCGLLSALLAVGGHRAQQEVGGLLGQPRSREDRRLSPLSTLTQFPMYSAFWSLPSMPRSAQRNATASSATSSSIAQDSEPHRPVRSRAKRMSWPFGDESSTCRSSDSSELSPGRPNMRLLSVHPARSSSHTRFCRRSR